MIDWLPAAVDPLPALLLVLASALTSAITASFGIGGGVAMLVILLGFMPPVIALPVHAIIQLGSNTGRALMLHKHLHRPVLLWFVPGAVLGVLLASQFFVALPVKALQWILALFILFTLWSPRLKARAVPERAYLGVGLFSSFASLFIGAGGPLVAAFLSPDRYGRDRTVATHAACMTVQHLAKLVAFGLLGFVFIEWVVLLAAMICSGLVGTWAGKTLLGRIPERTFSLVFKLVLSALALRLMVQAGLG